MFRDLATGKILKIELRAYVDIQNSPTYENLVSQ